jgi:hypothetical protein
MGHLSIIFDDTGIFFNAGMTAGDFFDRLERRDTSQGERFFIDSGPGSDYPDSVRVNLFANVRTSNKIPFDKRCSGKAEAVMDSLKIKAEWKTGLNTRPVSKMTVRHLSRNEMAPTALWGYELAISSEGVPLTDHLVVSVYGPDSSLIARFSGAP